ncbi:LysR substrate-binding domain-containing protein [Photorhabdus stackebrandtii]|uniref:LysR substrate-binding domain-containing protein n=1 Tax=Photorhabdus stackebrandtii TaxID=1123042 RepID=UPI0030EBFFB9
MSTDRLLNGTLKITILSEAGSQLLAPLLAKFARLHPNLMLLCDTQLMPRDVIEDDIDILLTFNRELLENSAYHAKTLARWFYLTKWRTGVKSAP